MLEFQHQVSSYHTNVGIALAFIPLRMTLTFVFSNESWQSWAVLLNVLTKKKKACLRAPSGKQWRVGWAEKGAHCCKGTQCSGTLVQVFWWIRHALCRISMHRGTKKPGWQWGGGTTGHQTPAWLLTMIWSSNHRGLERTGHLRRFWVTSVTAISSTLPVSDQMINCKVINVSGVTDRGGGTLHSSSHHKPLFFQLMQVLFKPHHKKRFHVSFYLPCI